jgi:hypothetical protein
MTHHTTHGQNCICHSCAPQVGDVATVNVDGRLHTGTVYYVQPNGWRNVENERTVAGGPLASPWARVAGGLRSGS